MPTKMVFQKDWFSVDTRAESGVDTPDVWCVELAENFRAEHSTLSAEDFKTSN